MFFFFYQRFVALQTSSIFKTNSIGILAPYQRCIGSQKETNFILYTSFFFSIYLQPWQGFNRSRYLGLFLKGFSQTINLIQNKYFKKYLKILNCQIITKDLSWCKRWNRFPKMILKGIVWKFITFLRSICPQALVHTSMYMFPVFIGICEQSRYIFCSTFYVLRSSIDSITS